MTNKLNNGIFSLKDEEDQPKREPHVSPKLPKKYKYLEKYQYGELGVAMMSSFNPNNTVETCDCPVCNTEITSGKWDVINNRTERVFICKKCELAYVSKVGEQKLRMYANNVSVMDMFKKAVNFK